MELQALQKMTVKKLREVALKYPDISGVHGMKKEELIEVLKVVFGIVESADEAKARIAAEKSKIKADMKKFKDERDSALASKDNAKLKKARFHIKRLKRELRRATA